MNGTEGSTTEVVSHYTEEDRAALREIFARLPGAIPVACKGSAHGGDPSDWDDHMDAKAPFLHATGFSYKWKMEANVRMVRAGLDEVPLVGIGLQSAGLAALDDDQRPKAPPLEGMVGVPSRDGSHVHWLCRKGPGAWRDTKWAKDESSGGEVKQKGYVCIWHPVAFLRAVIALEWCEPVPWEHVFRLGKARQERREKADGQEHPGPTFRSVYDARHCFDVLLPEGRRHTTMRAATASLVVRGIDPECLRGPFLAQFGAEEHDQREADFDRAVRMAREKLASGEWQARTAPKAPEPPTDEEYAEAMATVLERPQAHIEEPRVLKFGGVPMPSGIPDLIQSQGTAADGWLMRTSKDRRPIRYRHFAAGGKESDRLAVGRFLKYEAGRGWVPYSGLRGIIQRWCEESLQAKVSYQDKAPPYAWKTMIKNLPKEGGSADFASGVMKLIATREGVGIYENEVDQQPLMLGLPEGKVVSLATGEMVRSPASLLITRSTAVAPADDAERFLTYLARRLPIEHVRERWLIEAARTLTIGRTSKRVCWSVGPPDTFKSAYHGCFRRALGVSAEGGYAGKLPSAYMVDGRREDSNKLNSELAKLEGARVAVYDETPMFNGKPPPWSSRFVGELTDSESGISAREIGEGSVSLKGLGYLCAANHLPRLFADSGAAILKRLLIVPWENAEPDAEEVHWLMTRDAQAECLRAVLDRVPMALRMDDTFPVPHACAVELARYAETAER